MNNKVAHITLSQGKTAVVDADDVELLSAYRWYVTPYGYAQGRRIGGDRSMVRMHRLIAGAQPGIEVDHVNGDKLDNRKSNLRLCSHAQNTHNRKKYCTNKSGFKGVSWSKSNHGWVAVIRHGYNRYLGTFSTKEEAATAYDAAARLLHGEFANVNGLDS